MQVGSWQGGYMFIILTGGKQKRVDLNRSASGFKDMERTMEEAGVLKRIGVMTKEDYEQAARQKMPFVHTNDSGTFFGALISIAVNGFSQTQCCGWIAGIETSLPYESPKGKNWGR